MDKVLGLLYLGIGGCARNQVFKSADCDGTGKAVSKSDVHHVKHLPLK